MKKNFLFVLFFISSFVFISNAQGGLCSEVEPFCAGGNALVFPNSHPGVPGASNQAESGLDYSCRTGAGPNNPADWPYPSWYYLRIDSDGDLEFSISQSQNSDGSGQAFDVDFAAWGPFNTPDVNCGADLDNQNKIDCSWLPDTTEFMRISGALAGEIYIIMITNFSEQPGFITLQQTNSNNSSAGATDCSIVNSIDLCENEIISLDATTAEASRYEWFKDGILLPETGPILNNVIAPSALYTAEVYNIFDVIISVVEFNVNFFDQPTANDDGEVILYEICDETGFNDGIAEFNLATQNTEIYDGQTPSDFILTYHSSFDNAVNNEFALPELYENVSNPEIIYARLSRKVSPDQCFAIAELTLRVKLVPILNLNDRYILCVSSNGTEAVEIFPLIDTGLSDDSYNFQWSLDGVTLAEETGPSITATQGGIYSVLVTDLNTSALPTCSNFGETEVFESELPALSLALNSETFAGNNTIVAIAATTSTNTTFEYSLDNGPWQDEGVFNNVSAGNRIIKARDKNGCGEVSESILVIDYPLFFTPNGDGTNETWNIIGIDTQPDAVIYIYDRYGKLLKQLSPEGQGWNGTFNGNIMPASDYWFKIVYTEQLTGNQKEFRSHFSLKK
jgi:gliding motility-associated-like protein